MNSKEKISTYAQNTWNATKKGAFLLTIPFALASCNDKANRIPSYVGITNNGTKISAYITASGLVKNMVAKKEGKTISVNFYSSPRVLGNDSSNSYSAGRIGSIIELRNREDSCFYANQVTFANEKDTIVFAGIKNIPSPVNKTIAKLISNVDSLKTAEYNNKLSEIKSAFK